MGVSVSININEGEKIWLEDKSHSHGWKPGRTEEEVHECLRMKGPRPK